ncbi:MbeB family mobilization protein, partial [Serratia marcescens]|uniref:MbeB family mobilization protein n=1 Tax=Serratia marcescens TaxID=615 RepID=UPI002892C198
MSAQASATEQMLTREFSEHEQRVSEALRLSEQKISAAIAGHTEGMNAVLESHRLNVYRMVRRKWVSIVITTGLLVGMSGGFLWSLGDDIRTSQRELKRLNADIEAQRETL